MPPAPRFSDPLPVLQCGIAAYAVNEQAIILDYWRTVRLGFADNASNPFIARSPVLANLAEKQD